MKKAVVALGGNALIREGQKGTIYEQFANARLSLTGIIELLKEGYSVVLTHGNGPQAGADLIRQEKGEPDVPGLPLGVVVAGTQGWIGYMIEQSLQNRLKKEGLNYNVVTLVTQVVVDKDDPSFQNPTKFVGPFYKEEDLPQLKEKGWIVKEDPGRGYRRVVPSPMPKNIVNSETINQLLEEGNNVVIAVGGGGIPVYIDERGNYEGIDAVIDKDRASALLANQINAELFMILTGVPRVCINFRKPDQRELEHLKVEEAERYLKEGQFPPGSMGPKIEAAITYLRNGGERVIIGSIDLAKEALKGTSGTVITKG